MAEIHTNVAYDLFDLDQSTNIEPQEVPYARVATSFSSRFGDSKGGLLTGEYDQNLAPHNQGMPRDLYVARQHNKPISVDLSRGKPFVGRFKVEVKWEGLVDAINDDTFEARLRYLIPNKYGEEAVTIPLESVDEEDRKFVKPGAIFYLTIGTKRKALHSPVVRIAELTFRRLPMWRKEDLQQALAETDVLLQD